MALADVHVSPTDRQSVGLKAYSRLAAQWQLTLREAAHLLDVSESTWKRIKSGQFSGDLTRDQTLRLSALIGLYKALALYFDPPLSERWVKLENTGPLFDGQRPLDRMIEGGLPTIIAVRTYIDALRGGA
ncbi:MAG: antitoxin Xre-like helix-turn-helix domain-containing protein [Hyphomicrobiales bacterium]